MWSPLPDTSRRLRTKGGHPWREMISIVALSPESLLEEGRSALRAGDATGARRAFEQAADGCAPGDVLEGLARAAYLERAFPEAIETWERAYAAHHDAGDQMGTVRVARTLSYMYAALLGDWAVSGGWMARAQTLLGGDTESREAGWVALNLATFEADRARKEQHLREALAVGRRVGDSDLEVVALGYLGASVVHDDRTDEGMALLDEALAAVTGGEVDDFAILEEVFCQLFSACEHASDIARADQWIRIGDRIAARRNLPAVAAFCSTHYGGLLTRAGRWPEAEAALTDAIRLWGLGRRANFRTGALLRLADLRVRQGRFEEAEQLLDGVDLDAETDAARSVAAIQLAKGEATLAADTLERALDRHDADGTAMAPLLSLLVDVHLAGARQDAAEAAADRLVECAQRHPSDHLRASAALARGRVCLASGTGEPQACLREALAGFSRAQMPVEQARARLELASALVADHPDVARAEARSALEVFDRLGMARDVDAAAAVLRTLGVKIATPRPGDGLLTKREVEVLDLLGHGLSNPEIADRLFISRKTVEHHVGHVLAKLGLRSRSEAAAYATRTQGRGREPGDQ